METAQRTWQTLFIPQVLAAFDSASEATALWRSTNVLLLLLLLRSASSTDYSLPRLLTKFGERAFSHAEPAAWNALPEDIRANHDRAVFRKQLKTHFFSLAFNVR